jgi:hypothetical protein
MKEQMNYFLERDRISDIPIPIPGFKTISMFGKNRVGFSSPKSAQIEINKHYPGLKARAIFQDFNYFDGSVFGKIERRTAILVKEED